MERLLPRTAWRRIAVAFGVTVVVTIAALQPAWGLRDPARLGVRWALAVLWAAVALQSYRAARSLLADRVAGGARIAAQTALFAGLVAVVLMVLWLLGVSPGGIAVGGALTGIVLGLAAQSSLSNLFAGVVLMAARPFVPGDRVSLRSWYFSGNEYGGRVADLNFFYTVLQDGDRRIVVPNVAVAVATVTVWGERRERVAVALPLSCDLHAAARLLDRRVPGARLELERIAEDQAWVAVELPPATDPLDLAAWAAACRSGSAPPA
jgi:small conductance mechanosensitive channel